MAVACRYQRHRGTWRRVSRWTEGTPSHAIVYPVVRLQHAVFLDHLDTPPPSFDTGAALILPCLHAERVWTELVVKFRTFILFVSFRRFLVTFE